MNGAGARPTDEDRTTWEWAWAQNGIRARAAA
jgi:hypothetical protein